MIKPHAVPQSILDVEFKLFGSLTVRQFGYVAGGIVAGLFFYFAFGWFPLLQWSLIIISVIFGLLMGLYKINDRPFEEYFNNYLYALFTNQRSVYRKSIKTLDILSTYVPNENLARRAEAANVNKLKIDSLDLSRFEARSRENKKNFLDIEEDQLYSKVDKLFSNMEASHKPQVVNNSVQPNSTTNISQPNVSNGVNVPTTNQSSVQRVFLNHAQVVENKIGASIPMKSVEALQNSHVKRKLTPQEMRMMQVFRMSVARRLQSKN